MAGRRPDVVDTTTRCLRARGGRGKATTMGWRPRQQQDVRLHALVLHLGALVIVLLVGERPVEHQEQPTPHAPTGHGDG